MTDNPTGGVVLVFGATGSVGTALSRRLVRQGHHVTLAGRDEQRLQSLAAELDMPCVVVDAASSESIDRGFEQWAGSGTPLTGVVNCIGSVLLKPAHLTTDAEWNDTLTTNLFSSFAIVRGAAKVMKGAGGSIVLVSSAASQIGIANHEAIAAAKAGVMGLTRSAAATYAANNIRVNAVAPGLVRSNMTRRLWENPASATASEQMHALGRLGEPDQVASLIEWLLRPDNDWITGQVIGVDGGLGSLLPRRR